MSPPLRLFMTTDAVGGVWTYALDLASGLATRGYETTLATLGPSPSADQLRAAERIPGLTVIDTRLPLDWTAAEGGEIEQAGAAIRGLARRSGAEIIHLNSPALAAAGGFDAPVVGACHSCLASWWSTVKDGPMPEDFRWRTQLLWRGLVACNVLIAPTAAFAAATARAYDVPPPQVVHNGRAADIAPAARREAVVFTSGRLWDEGKNVGVLDAAAGVTSIPVQAAGPVTGPNGAALRPMRNLRLLGVLSADQVRERLRQASIYASSALYEPFGLGVLEAAQAGCALVLSDIPTFRELWSGVALFVDPRSPQGFASAFTQLAADQTQAHRLGQRARERARTFNVEAMTRRMDEIYGQLLQIRAPSRGREAAA